MKTLAAFLLLCSTVACIDSADDPLLLAADSEEVATPVELEVPPAAADEAAKLEAQKRASMAASSVSSALEDGLAAACGKAGPNLENRTVADAATPNYALQRSGSSTSCTALGQLNPPDDAVYYCYTSAGSYTWTYLRSLRSGIKGWVRDDLLRLNPGGSRGSVWYCGF